MGQFSWLDCKDKSQILIYEDRPAYVLVPEPFQKEYGDRELPYHIEEDHYNGYGDFGRYDIYALAADWNREALREKLEFPDRKFVKGDLLRKEYSAGSIEKLKKLVGPEPKLEQFGGLYDFEKKDMLTRGATAEQVEAASQKQQKKYYDIAVVRYNTKVQRLRDFLTYSLSPEEMEKKYGEDYKREIGIDIACYDKQNIKLPYPIEVTHDPEAVFDEKTPSLSDEHQGVYYNKDREEAMEKIEDALDKAGVKYDIDAYYACVEFWAGNNGALNIHVELEYDNTPEDLVVQFAAYAQNFDAEEEASLYAEDDEISPDDCREAKTALMDLAVRLEEALGKEAACEIAETHTDTQDTECEEL